MSKFTIPTKFVFSGEFTVEAENEQEAKQIVERDCGLCLGGNIHSTDSDVDWDFDNHPEKVVQGNVIQVKVDEHSIQVFEGERKIHSVVTVQKSACGEYDLYADVIGSYDTEAEAQEVADKVTNREEIEGLDYDLLVEFEEAHVISLPLNTTVRNSQEVDDES